MEIERKWLIAKDEIPYPLDTLPCTRIEQQYISFSPTIRIRKINRGEKYIMTVKVKPEKGNQDLEREEYEFPISEEEYENLLPLVQGKNVVKDRYVNILPSGLHEEIDIFHEELEGLAYLEIEFPDLAAAEEYPNPVWTIRDITSEKCYKNAALAIDGMPEM